MGKEKGPRSLHVEHRQLVFCCKYICPSKHRSWGWGIATLGTLFVLLLPFRSVSTLLMPAFAIGALRAFAMEEMELTCNVLVTTRRRILRFERCPFSRLRLLLLASACQEERVPIFCTLRLRLGFCLGFCIFFGRGKRITQLAILEGLLLVFPNSSLPWLLSPAD